MIPSLTMRVLQTIAEGLRLLDLSPDMPNPSLSRLHRQSQAVRSKGDKGRLVHESEREREEEGQRRTEKDSGRR